MIGRAAGTVSDNAAVGETSTRRSASSGSHRTSGSSKPNRPIATRRRADALVIAFVIDWMRMIASGRIGGPSTAIEPTATVSGG
ncbi:hypothetical protein GCM10010932_20500 [Agromyces flavus]|nr:hypothetical protein GCM10010932_20500 [Agromyces flavus]